jgi:probable H4MPT-linked C1 transfer pathway protein
MQSSILGWDIGGAHVKAALLGAGGEVLSVVQIPCPLWKGLQYLCQAIDAVLAALPGPCTRHAVTMTGELADCFESREQGVNAILQTLQVKLDPAEILVFAGRSGIVPWQSAQNCDYLDIASANWIASAQLAAGRVGDGLFVDIGSTTTDILLLQNHVLRATGFSDYERLVSGELLYSGIIRTPVMAVANRAMFNGREMGLMAEYFATMADVYRVTGDLNEAHDQTDTADGTAKTPEASARRLSRLTGYEFDLGDWALWTEFADTLKWLQGRNIQNACAQRLRDVHLAKAGCLVGAGVGRFLLKELAAELGMVYRDFNELLPKVSASGSIDAGDCAPAVAVAFLAGGFG